MITMGKIATAAYVLLDGTTPVVREMEADMAEDCSIRQQLANPEHPAAVV